METIMIGKDIKSISLAFGLSALSISGVPASAASWTPPGVTMGLPLGAAADPGIYFSNLTHYGSGPTKTLTAEVPSFAWSTGLNFFGASYSAVLILEALELRVPGPTSVFRDGIFNPLIIPLSLSWNLGQGFFVSFGEGFYPPVNTSVAFTTLGHDSGVVAESRLAISYLKDDWVLSANTIFGATTPDAVGNRTPDYFNIDWTVAHNFGNWRLGFVGYGAWDLEKTVVDSTTGQGQIVGVGGLVGYDFGGPVVLVEATRAIDQSGNTNYGKDDTHVWGRLTVPISNFSFASAPSAVPMKY
jgi:hypothetical protein